jgi:hypothetical protein
LAIGIDARSEVTGSLWRSDLVVKLPGQIYVVIELKYLPDRKTLLEDEGNSFLAAAAMELSPIEELDESLEKIGFN